MDNVPNSQPINNQQPVNNQAPIVQDKPAHSRTTILLWTTIIILTILLVLAVAGIYIIGKGGLARVTGLKQVIELPINTDREKVLGIGFMYRFETKLVSVTQDQNKTILNIADKFGLPPILISPTTKIYLHNSVVSENKTDATSFRPNQRVTLIYLYKPQNEEYKWDLQQVIINSDTQSK